MIVATKRKTSQWPFGLLIVVAAALLPGFVKAQSCVIPPPGIVSWWRAEGDPIDSLRRNVFLETLGQPSYTIGIAGNGFHFHGDDGFRYLNSESLDLMVTDELTIEGWLLVESVGKSGNDAIVDKRGDNASGDGQKGYVLSVVGPPFQDPGFSAFNLVVKSDDAFVEVETSAVPDNEFHHVAFTIGDGGYTAKI